MAIRSSADATLIVDEAFNILDRNEAAEQVFGRGRQAAKTFSELVAPSVTQNLSVLHRELTEAGSCRVEMEMRSWTGGTFSADVSMSRFALADVAAFQVNVHDVMHRKRNEAQLRHVATHDSLTDLPNRLALLDEMTNLQASDTPSALIWLGIDRFKLVNDSLGYRAGDELLVALAERLASVVDDERHIAHLGGDNFAILIEGVEDDVDAMRRVLPVAKEIAKPLQLRGRPLYVTASIGIALQETQYADPEDWLADTEIALFRAKRQGRGQIVVFEAHQRLQVAAELDLDNELRQALEQGEFELHYQPIVALDECRLSALEALVRWRSPKRGLVRPGEFLPAMARAGMQAELDRVVLRIAIEQLSQWNELYGRKNVPRVHINVSSERFVGEDLYGELGKLLKQTYVSPSQVELEITEHTLFEFPERVAELLSQLKEAGVRVALDDFGTGFSSLSYLQRYPVDTLKIDRTFVNVATRSSAILQVLVMLGDALGMELVAEGIESEEELELARNLGCDFGQGFHIARPIPASDVARILVPASSYEEWHSRIA